MIVVRTKCLSVYRSVCLQDTKNRRQGYLSTVHGVVQEAGKVILILKNHFYKTSINIYNIDHFGYFLKL
jgi:hypothetical protein